MSYTKKLFESLNESYKDVLLSKIRFVKNLLGKGMNDENYQDMDDNQLYVILNKYREEFNNSNIEKYLVNIFIYNKDKNSATDGYLSNDNTLSYNKKDALIFNSKEEAENAKDNYIIHEDYTLIDSKVELLKL